MVIINESLCGLSLHDGSIIVGAIAIIWGMFQSSHGFIYLRLSKHEIAEYFSMNRNGTFYIVPDSKAVPPEGQQLLTFDDKDKIVRGLKLDALKELITSPLLVVLGVLEIIGVTKRSKIMLSLFLIYCSIMLATIVVLKIYVIALFVQGGDFGKSMSVLYFVILGCWILIVIYCLLIVYSYFQSLNTIRNTHN